MQKGTMLFEPPARRQSKCRQAGGGLPVVWPGTLRRLEQQDLNAKEDLRCRFLIGGVEIQKDKIRRRRFEFAHIQAFYAKTVRAGFGMLAYSFPHAQAGHL